MGLTLDRVSYMGNDINDIECLEVVGLPVCVADSYPEVIAVSKLITGKNGGCGAVREFCDFVASIMMGKTRSVKKAPEFIEG
ncbi:MAG: HAD hydrolase family protein [Rubrobacteridae bacterium]|nr:HAD hydrolase family protein [Rubrobacteridae bacterium]